MRRTLASPNTDITRSATITHLVLTGAACWLVSTVATLFSERFLVRIHEPAMPRQEVPREVYEQGLVDVRDNEAVELRTQ